MTVSLPYEAGRAAYAPPPRTADDLAALAHTGESRSCRRARRAHPRRRSPTLGARSSADEGSSGRRSTARFASSRSRRPRRSSSCREEILELLARRQPPPEGIAVLAPSVQRWRAPLEIARHARRPVRDRGDVRLGRTPFGRALLGLLRFAWLRGARGDLFAYLRSPFSGFARSSVDFLEGGLRGRAIRDPD